MAAVIRLDRHLHRWHRGGGIIVLHRLLIVTHVRRAMGAAGFGKELIGRNGRLVIHQCDVARQSRVLGSALIMASAMDGLSGVAIMRLGQREIFARRRRRRDITVMSVADAGQVVRVLERSRTAVAGISMRSIVMIGCLGLRDQVLIGLRGIG